MPGIQIPEFYFFRRLCGFEQPFQTFIETGLFQGGTCRRAAASYEFQRVHSIEISQAYIDRFRETSPDPCIELHQGNSADLLPKIAPALPTFFYLDAHWWHDPIDPIDCPKDGLPLFKELDFILSRPYSELVVVDDIQAFGGAPNVTEEWKEVTVDKLNERFGARRRFSFMHDLRYVIATKEI